MDRKKVMKQSLWVTLAVVLAAVGPKSSGQPAAVDAGEPDETASNALCGAYFYVDQQTTSTLDLSNTGRESRTVRPVVLLEGRKRVPLDRITIHPKRTIRIHLGKSIREKLDLDAGDLPTTKGRWGDGSRRPGAWGSVLVEGNTGGLSAWVLSTSLSESVQINTVLERSPGWDTRYSMWWKPTPETEVRYALLNPGETDLQIETQVHLHDRKVYGASFSIPAGESRLISLEEIFSTYELGFSRIPETGSILFYSTGLEGFVLRAINVDERIGFSVPLASHPHPSFNRNAELQIPPTPLGTPDPELGFPSGVLFSPHLLLTNVSYLPIEITPILYGRAAGSDKDGEPRTGAPIELGPHESRVVDVLNESFENSDVRSKISGMVSIGLSGPTSSLLAEAVTVSVDPGRLYRYSFYDPFTNANRALTSHTAISFDLSGSKNSLLVAKNTTDLPAEVWMFLTYEKQDGSVGQYATPVEALDPQGLKIFNVESLRDSATPDREGRTLPGDLAFGHAILLHTKGIIAGDPTFDPVFGTCASCPAPCDEPLEPNEPEVIDGCDCGYETDVAYFNIQYGYSFGGPSGDEWDCFYKPCDIEGPLPVPNSEIPTLWPIFNWFEPCPDGWMIRYQRRITINTCDDTGWTTYLRIVDFKWPHACPP